MAPQLPYSSTVYRTVNLVDFSSSPPLKPAATMFKLAILFAVAAVAAAAPGGLTGHIVDHGVGPIHAPNVISHSHPQHVAVVAQPISHAPVAVAHVAHVAHAAPLVHHQPLAPIVHSAPIVTRTHLPGHDHYAPVLSHGHGLGLLH